MVIDNVTCVIVLDQMASVIVLGQMASVINVIYFQNKLDNITDYHSYKHNYSRYYA
jgi:hypothetical protein